MLRRRALYRSLPRPEMEPSGGLHRLWHSAVPKTAQFLGNQHLESCCVEVFQVAYTEAGQRTRSLRHRPRRFATSLVYDQPAQTDFKSYSNRP